MSSSASPLNVLLVEDNAADARLVHEMLKEEARSTVAVTHATGLREALAYLQARNFSAVLLDLTLPDSDGLDTFIRARSEAPQAPIVVLTGLSDEAVAAAAVRQGAQDYLVKGRVDGRLLYHSLRYAVERSSITERLRGSETRYRSLVEGSIQGILIHVDGAIRFANQAFADAIGVATAGDMVGRTIWSFVPRDEGPRLEQYLDARRAGEPATSHLELQAVRTDGRVVWLDCVVTSITWDGEEACLITVVDVTTRRRAEADLRLSEERFRLLADNIKEAFLIIDVPSFRSAYLSGAWSEIWGRPLREALENPHLWFDAIHAEDRDAVLAGQQAILRGEAAIDVFRVVRPDGTVRWVRARTFPVFNGGGGLYRMVGLAEDITAVRDTEEQLQQAQKMEAVGRLAGGIAHDFNNLLSAILGFSQLVIDDLGPTHPSTPDVEQIRDAGQSAEGLTRQLLAFSRRQILQPQSLNPNDVIGRMQSLLRRLLGEDVALELRLAETVGRINADPGQIEQVIMNLAINARDAMPDGGRLTIETASVEFDDEYVSHHVGTTPGPHVLVAVTDTGTGMDETTQKRLFEPFFTTKEAGKGTGLGLATVYGIVTQSRGFIWVYSELGVGSTFKVYFPEGAGAAPAPTPREQPLQENGTETILVVEDQPELLAIAALILRRRGYRVLEAENAGKALTVVREYGETIHVLLTDVVMPGIGGRQLAQQVCALRPEIRPIYMSGYTDDTILRHGILDSALAFVQKPFTPSGLARKVREVLDTPDGPSG